MDSYNILIIDDQYTNLNAMKNTLVKFGYSEQNIYPEDTSAIDNFTEEITKFATGKKYDDLYYFIFRYIEAHDISAIFLDLNHDQSSATTHDKPMTSSGERLGIKLISNKLHNNIPIVIYTRYAEDDLEINKKLQTHVGRELYCTEKLGEHFVSDSLYDLLKENGFKKERIDRKAYEYIQQKRKTNISVLCALKLEFDAVVNVLNDIEDGHSMCGKIGYIRDKNNRIYKVGVEYMKQEDFGYYGISECQEKANNIIKRCKPEYLIMTGVMGGVEQKVKIGDVVIAKKAFEWDYSRDPCDKGYMSKDKPSFECSGSLIGNIELLAKNSTGIVNGKKKLFKVDEELQIKFGLVGTGNSVLNDEKKLKCITESQPHMIGFEMEIVSLYRVANGCDDVKTVALKTVVDYGDGTKSKEYQEQGAQLSAEVFHKLFTEYIDIG